MFQSFWLLLPGRVVRLVFPGFSSKADTASKYFCYRRCTKQSQNLFELHSMATLGPHFSPLFVKLFEILQGACYFDVSDQTWR